MTKEVLTVLIVLTSHDQLGDSGEKTGFWLEEFTTPYYTFLDAGISITLASPMGGLPPIDPRSLASNSQTESTKRFLADDKARDQLANTNKLSAVSADNFDAIFYPGGHGPLWDLVTDKNSIDLIESFWSQGKPVSAVCHAPAVLLHARNQDGQLIIKDKNVTGFTNSEEDAVGLTDSVPLLLETELSHSGASFSSTNDFEAHIVTDGNLITGQNPASSAGVANALIELLKSR
ncbi:MAG: type 1 glutamine amidotransferase domain-containing protein [Pseudomonadota bacterium]